MTKGEIVFLILSLVLFSALVYYIFKYYTLTNTFDQKLFDYKQNELDKKMEEFTLKCEKELETFKEQASSLAQQQAQINFQQWKEEEDKNIRKDAINKSQSIIMGKVTEHLIPYLPEFNYNPKDARFLGSPIDLIVFDGLSDGELKQIIFVEIKTGKSQLSQREKMIKEAISLGKVKWEEIRHVVEDKTEATMKRLGLSFEK